MFLFSKTWVYSTALLGGEEGTAGTMKLCCRSVCAWCLPWGRWCSPRCSPGCIQTHGPWSASCPSGPPARSWLAAHVYSGQSGRRTLPRFLSDTLTRTGGGLQGEEQTQQRGRQSALVELAITTSTTHSQNQSWVHLMTSPQITLSQHSAEAFTFVLFCEWS